MNGYTFKTVRNQNKLSTEELGVALGISRAMAFALASDRSEFPAYVTNQLELLSLLSEEKRAEYLEESLTEYRKTRLRKNKVKDDDHDESGLLFESEEE